MEVEYANPKLALECLPIETKQAIMSFLPDVWSLKSIALTSSSLFYAFINSELRITSQVLLNEVEFDVLPEAAAALESSRLKPWNRQRIHAFILQHLRIRRPPRQTWTLSDALLVSELYKHIHYFVTDFAFKSLVEPSTSSYVKPDQAPLLPTETARIMRAFYRFEVYCNIFRDPERTLFDIREQRQIFFSNFSVWENEQLACVHDYLSRAVSPAFNDIAEHDIAWGEFSVEYGDRIDSVFIQHLLSLGLAELHQIILSETYEARYKLLYCDHPLFNGEFLYEGLKMANEADNGVCLCDYTEDEELVHIRPPFFPEIDTGPAYAWRWAHLEETCVQFLNVDSQRSLRESGYTLWDRTRLNKWDIFQMPRETLQDAPDVGETQRIAEMHVSFTQRSKIFMAGGRGWWSLGDRSKITWLYNDNTLKPRFWTRREREVGSLSEARDFLASLKCPSPKSRT